MNLFIEFTGICSDGWFHRESPPWLWVVVGLCTAALKGQVVLKPEGSTLNVILASQISQNPSRETLFNDQKSDRRIGQFIIGTDADLSLINRHHPLTALHGSVQSITGTWSDLVPEQLQTTTVTSSKFFSTFRHKAIVCLVSPAMTWRPASRPVSAGTGSGPPRPCVG